MERIRVVLVEPRGPINVGAVARAMKNMGAKELALVKPRCPPLHPHALVMAVGAKDVLVEAQVYESLREAIASSALVVGTTRRRGKRRRDLLTLREAAEEILAVASRQRVSLLFGPEDRGLSTRELAFCQRAITIPADPEHGSLNLAQAVMVVLYELRATSIPPSPSRHLATSEELEGFYRHMEEVLVKIGFLDPRNPERMMAELRRIFSRAELDPREVRILRGILHQMEWAIRNLPPKG